MFCRPLSVLDGIILTERLSQNCHTREDLPVCNDRCRSFHSILCLDIPLLLCYTFFLHTGLADSIGRQPSIAAAVIPQMCLLRRDYCDE